VPGQILASADVNSWFVPLAAPKLSDTSRPSTTTLANDPALALPLAANATYWFMTEVIYEAPNPAGDLKFQWTVPAGAVLNGQFLFRIFGGGDDLHSPITAGALQTTNGSGAGVNLVLGAFGTIIMSSTAGNLNFQWAQNTSNATPTIVHTGSGLMAWRTG
jgi:hypothetical protein